MLILIAWFICLLQYYKINQGIVLTRCQLICMFIACLNRPQNHLVFRLSLHFENNSFVTLARHLMFLTPDWPISSIHESWAEDRRHTRSELWFGELGWVRPEEIRITEIFCRKYLEKLTSCCQSFSSPLVLLSRPWPLRTARARTRLTTRRARPMQMSVQREWPLFLWKRQAQS